MNETIAKLEEICQKYPQSIPVAVAAEFEGIDPETLRTALKNKTCPFGYISNPGYRAKFVIPTLAFYMFHTCGRVFDTGAVV